MLWLLLFINLLAYNPEADRFASKGYPATDTYKKTLHYAAVSICIKIRRLWHPPVGGRQFTRSGCKKLYRQSLGQKCVDQRKANKPNKKPDCDTRCKDAGNDHF